MSTGKRLWLGAVMMLMLVGCSAPASEATPTPQPDQTLAALSVSPLSGTPGTPVAVVGNGWQPGATILIYVQDPAAAPSTPADQVAVQVATTIVGADGRFVAAFALPTDLPWRDLARVAIRADAPATSESASVEFVIVQGGPTATLSAVATSTLAPIASATPAVATSTIAPTAAGCIDRAEFVGDVTILDQTNLAPGAAFIKTWRLRNAGTCTWDTTYALVFARGDNLGGPSAAALAGSVAPGNTLDVSVGLSAPAVNGIYRSYWQLRSRAGNFFGIGSDGLQPFWVNIIVGPTPTPVIVSAWRGEYFANRDLAGAPVLVRDDADFNFSWGAAAPATTLPADSFSARWTRSLNFAAGTYRFYARADDGLRVWLNGELVIDQWHDAANTTYSIDRTLPSGPAALRVEYYENKGDAHAQIWWERAGDYPQWRGDYFANATLSGTPALVRNDADLNFNWGTGAPATGLPADNFSVRWSRNPSFDAATYRFHVLADDGVRFYIDGVLLVDDWRDGNARNASIDVRLTAGNHPLRVEYYERGGNAVAQLWWEKIGETFPEWKGQYWANRNLAGNPSVTRNDTALNFDWGTGSPASGLPADEFSARWTRSVTFTPGRYRFTVRADDGVRVFIDSALIINEWHFNDGRAAVQADVALGGTQRIVVEYFEGGGGALINVNWVRLGDNPSPTFTPTKTPTLTPTRTPTATASVVPPAGLVLQGRVTFKDDPQRGLSNVSIYRSFAGNPGVVGRRHLRTGSIQLATLLWLQDLSTGFQGQSDRAATTHHGDVHSHANTDRDGDFDP